MKKSKSIETLDRLSELPDSLIFVIFGLMTMREIVVTTILSKRWRNLWTTVPCLNFDDRWDPDPEYFITRALMFWRGTKILKFKIELSCKFDDENTIKNIDSWVRFAKDFEVQELYLHPAVFSGRVENGHEYPVPQYLFSSCWSLKVLSLESCRLDIHRNVQWNQLKSLTIRSENGLRCGDIDRVLRGSPQLEVLVLKFYETHEHLTIRSTSLKKLSIGKFFGIYDEASPIDTRLIVSTPNLETFEISNLPYFYCSLDSVSSLTEVSLLFDTCGRGYREEIMELFEEALKQILPSIQHVENLTLSYYTIEALGELKMKNLAPRSWDVKFLKLKTSFSSFINVVAALEFFSKVKILVLEDTTKEEHWEEIINYYLQFQLSLPNLRRVEVILGRLDCFAIFSLLEILLKYASNLETMVFYLETMVYREDEFPSESALSFVSEKLERMQRSFPGKLIVYCDD